MKKQSILILTAVVFFACEKEVYIPLADPEPFLVVDAWVNTREEVQTITLSHTRPYFDNSQIAPANGADVKVINLTKEDTLVFEETGSTGRYTWDAVASPVSLGETGDFFLLEVDFEGVNYQSVTSLSPVPTIDSITFEYYPKDLFVQEDYYWGDFWARDLPGEGNTYWIKTWKNGLYLNKPSEINYAYDAGFAQGAPVDSLIFIQPIRSLMNPVDENKEEDSFYPPYLPEDSAYVEIHSISNAAWFFLARVYEETNVSGGFGALFATPLANVPTNIISDQEDEKVVGFFNVANISSFGARCNDQTIRDNIED